MNTRTTITLIIALFLSGAAAMIAKHWVDDQIGNKPSTPEIGTVQVYVAATKIPYASQINNIQLKLAAWPKDVLPDEAFTEDDIIKNPNAINGMIAQREFLTNEILLKSQIKDHLEGSTLSALIKPGLRAYSVRVIDDVAGVAGFILPGNKTDIIITGKANTTFGLNEPGAKKIDYTIACHEKAPGYKIIPKPTTGITRDTYTLLSNINILAVDQTATHEQDKPIVVRSLTLEVTPAESECLSEAIRMGNLVFTLRNSRDLSIVTREQAEDNTTIIEAIKAKPTYLKALPWSSQDFQICEVGVSC